MPVSRANVDFALDIFKKRVGNPYVYGGNWNRNNPSIGTDCSGLVVSICDAVRNGPNMGWSRHGMSTESWRPIEVGQMGTMFNTICVNSPSDFPPDAVVKIALHHGPGGGRNSHMWCEVQGIRMESNGSNGCVTGNQALSAYNTSYANDWHYLPGPIVDGGVVAPNTGMTIDTLAEAMGHTVSRERYAALLPSVKDALRKCGADNINRVAMWLGQIGHESGGLKYMEEIASGSAYEGRTDLGNTKPGFGVRYKGRGPIQITGFYNYQKLSEWAHKKGYVPTPTFFVDNPYQLASDQYGFLGVVWYWTVARPTINAMADDKNLEGVTRAINGGLNGLADRHTRYHRCIGMGFNKLNPGIESVTVGQPERESSLEELLMSDKLYPSVSIYATPGEGAKFTLAQLIQSVDGMRHRETVEEDARLGDLEAIGRIARTAAGQGAFKDAWAINHAKSVLAELEITHPAVLQKYLQSKGLA